MPAPGVLPVRALTFLKPILAAAINQGNAHRVGVFLFEN
jgi:hypothetical protein